MRLFQIKEIFLKIVDNLAGETIERSTDGLPPRKATSFSQLQMILTDHEQGIELKYNYKNTYLGRPHSSVCSYHPATLCLNQNLTILLNSIFNIEQGRESLLQVPQSATLKLS